uniref:Uncharacterized protein n=1 Tax=Amphimedon queenslandica TaxID=400682 RepID=A0A1X7UHC0_AMPQE
MIIILKISIKWRCEEGGLISEGCGLASCQLIIHAVVFKRLHKNGRINQQVHSHEEEE